MEIASAGCILSTSMPHGLGLPCHFTKLNRCTMTATTHTSSHQIEHEIKLVKRSSATAIHLLEAGAGVFSALARVLLWGTSVVAIDPAEACAGCQAHLPILQSTFTFSRCKWESTGFDCAPGFAPARLHATVNLVLSRTCLGSSCDLSKSRAKGSTLIRRPRWGGAQKLD